jgi:hypothetical protein
MNVFANLLIILPSRERKELVFGYLILFQPTGRWGRVAVDEWVIFLVGSEALSRLSLGFSFC